MNKVRVDAHKAGKNEERTLYITQKTKARKIFKSFPETSQRPISNSPNFRNKLMI